MSKSVKEIVNEILIIVTKKAHSRENKSGYKGTLWFEE